MCGISGVMVAEGITPGDEAIVRATMALMARRGPDDEGYWSDGRHVAFGFRRLSILDPSPAGHQPMVSSDGRCCLVFNGELYNFRELRRELEHTGLTFRSGTDTEVVLEALAAWGAGALERFNGMFALAFHDAGAGPRGELLLARDPVGIKPLHTLLTGRGLVFGSQYDQVVRHPWCERARLDSEVLTLYLRLSYVPAPYGLIQGTGQLEPGEVLTVRPGEAARRWHYRTWPPLATAHVPVRELGEEIRAAVRRQLVSDVPVGTFLSGGIDSPLVTAAAATEDPRLPAFTIGSDDPAFDERGPADAYAAALGVDHVTREIAVQDCLGLLDDVSAAYSEPFADYSAFPTLLVSQLARERVKVALSGDGGDELFWGYPRFARVLASRRWLQLPPALRWAAYAGGRLGRRVPRIPKGVTFADVGAWYLDAHSGLRERELALLGGGLGSLPPGFDLYERRRPGSHDDLAEWLRANELRGHLQMILTKVDRASMHHSLEVRVPLLDLEVVAHAMSVPVERCIDRGTGKLPLRAALADAVGPELVTPGKRGFSVPLGRWLRSDLRPMVEDLLLGGRAYPDGAFDGGGLRRIYDDHLAGRDQTRGLWSLLALQLWADRHLRPLAVAT